MSNSFEKDMETYEKYPIFVKKKKSKTCLILKRQKELQMDGNFDTSDINNLKRKKISRSPLDRWTVSSSINNNNNNKVIKTSDRIAWRKGERD